jgi:hypothetical protein
LSYTQADRPGPTTFEHQPGSVVARFYHSTFDYIELDLRMGGETTWIEQWDSAAMRKLEETRRVSKSSIEQTVYFSSVECAFPSFMRFLEAIVIGVEECAFSWCAEGPSGEMRWKGNSVNGTFTVTWPYERRRAKWSVFLCRRHLVHSLYGAFRSFVESDAYDPMRYESLRRWDYYQLLLRDATVGDLARALASRSASDVERVLRRLGRIAGERTEELNRRETLAWFLAVQDDEEAGDVSAPDDWNTWSDKQRMRHLGRHWGSTSVSQWYGSNLRRLKSRLIEEWLAKSARARA